MEVQLNKFSSIADTELGNKDVFVKDGTTDEATEVQTQAPKTIESAQQEIANKWEQRLLLIKSRFKIFVLVCMVLGYFGYFSYAMYCEFGDEGSIRLLSCTVFGVLYMAWTTSMKNERIHEKWTRLTLGISRWYSTGNRAKYIRWGLYAMALISCIVYIVMNVVLKSPEKLRSLLGMVVLVLLMIMLSSNKRKIKWHTVFWGFILQFAFGVFVLKMDAGRNALKWAADRLQEFVDNALSGSIFLFGPKYVDHPFAFIALPQIILFCAAIQVLEHIGTIPFIIRTVGGFVAFLLDVSPPEAMNASANILLGGAESSMAIHKHLKDMPYSQLFTVMTNGGATCAGSALIQIMAFGIQADYLFSASIMSVPAALACAKIMIPDGDEAETDTKDRQTQVTEADDEQEKIVDPYPEQRGVVEAVMVGTKTGLSLCALIIGVLIVFNAILDLLDGAVVWFGDRVKVELTLKIVLGYMFFPVAYMMGIDTRDCRSGAELIGIKILSNPILAYMDLGYLQDNRETFEEYTSIYNSTDWRQDGADIFLTKWNQTLTNGYVSERSEVVLTYALCGYASLTSLGGHMAVMIALVPSRIKDISQMAAPSVVAGIIASLLTACVAGLIA